MRLDAHLDINRLALEAGVAFTDFHTESYVPKTLAPMAGGRLSGRIDARADLGQKVGAPAADRSQARARTRAAGLPREVRVRGDAFVSPERVKTDGLTVSVTGRGGDRARLGRPRAAA